MEFSNSYNQPLISIDLRQSNLIKIPNSALKDNPAQIVIDNPNINYNLSERSSNNTLFSKTIIEKKEENIADTSMPSTIIHLKFINNDDCISKLDDQLISKNTENFLSSNSMLLPMPQSEELKNKNSDKFNNNFRNNSIFSEMRREIKANLNVGSTNKKDSNLAKFEMKKYLERIKSNKKLFDEDSSKSKYHYKKRKYFRYNKDYSFENFRDAPSAKKPNNLNINSSFTENNFLTIINSSFKELNEKTKITDISNLNTHLNLGSLNITNPQVESIKKPKNVNIGPAF